MKLYIRLLLSLIIFFTGMEVLAQDQKGFHFFKPSPRNQMRIFSIDRPDVTETAITVDPGHFQFEGDLIKWTKHNQGSSNRTLSFLNGLYKLGLTHSLDIHIGLEMYNIYQDAEGETIDKGYGSTTIRIKHNFWGNDGKKRTSFGMIPYVTFLSGDPFDSEMIYGIGLPFAYALNEKYELGAQPQFDFIPNEDGGRDVSFFQTVVLGGPLVGNLDFYIEGLAIFPRGKNQFLVNGGLIYNVSPNMKIDIAANQGLVKEAPTRVYLGLSFRI